MTVVVFDLVGNQVVTKVGAVVVLRLVVVLLGAVVELDLVGDAVEDN